MDIYELLKFAVVKQASDLHLSSGMQPYMRLNGKLEKIQEAKILEEPTLLKMLGLFLNQKQLERFIEQRELDFAVDVKDVCRIRGNLFFQYRGVSAALRLISKHIPDFAKLGFPKIFYELCNISHGLILVTGSTGSGKSTTIAAMIEYINQHNKAHILTLEDPIEYVFSKGSCLIDQREIGKHSVSFASALRAALREDPDYILIGEMRDLVTARLALTAAETGHLVFATLHTNSAIAAVNRIIDIFPSIEKSMIRATLANSLQVIIAQILLDKSRNFGGGRVAAQEIMVCNNAIRNMIREDKTPQIKSFIQSGKAQGMQTMEQHIELLRKRGIVDG